MESGDRATSGKTYLDHPVGASLLLFLCVAPLFYVTRTPPEAINVDTEPVAMTAWHFANEGTVDLAGFDTRDNYFVRDFETGRVLSNRPVGLWIVALPPYLLWKAPYSPEPSTVWSVVIASAAVVVMHLLLRRLVEPTWAFAGAVAFGLGTATWPISSSEIWPHGPGQLLLGLGLLALASSRVWLAGAAAALAVLVRPVTVVFPVTTAVAHAARKHWHVALATAAPVGVAVVALLLYNQWAFGTASISGGYGSGFTDRLSGSPIETFTRNLLDSLLSPNNGLLLWSPIVLVAVMGLRAVWAELPRWARDAVVAGGIYFVLHARLNRASGGLPFNYRYALEPLTMAWPALVVAARHLFDRGQLWRRVLIGALAASVTVQGLMAFRYECEAVPGDDSICSII